MYLKNWALIVALVWTSKFCFTRAQVTQFLNQLPNERSVEAKVVENKGFIVFYRVEEELPVPADKEN